MKKDILFIHPGNQRETYQGLASEFTAIATPVWSLLLAYSVATEGYDVAIYDTNVEGWSKDIAGKVLSKYNPELIVLMVYGHTPTASTQTMPAARTVATDIKSINQDIPVALGGLHPTTLPEKTLFEEPANFVIQGEGLDTILGLIRYYKGQEKLEHIPGLWYKKNDKITFTFPAQLITDLDNRLPYYAWDMLPDLKYYRAHNMHCFQDFHKSNKNDFSDVRSPYATIYTSLGCPFNCHYCCINALFGKRGIRYWSEDKVVDWIDMLVKRGVRNIRLDDELFVLDAIRVEKIADMLIEREYDINLWAYARVDTINDRLLPKLKKAGFNWLCLGIESGNEDVRSNVNKKMNSDIKDVVKKIQESGIFVLGNFMFGLPEDNFDTMQQTFQLAVDLKCEYVNFYAVMAMPGSQLYISALETPDVLPETWGGYSHHAYNTKPLPTKYLTASQVLEFRDKAFMKYITNPDYINLVMRKFGVKVVEHLQKMIQIPLKRRILEKS